MRPLSLGSTDDSSGSGPAIDAVARSWSGCRSIGDRRRYRLRPPGVFHRTALPRFRRTGRSATPRLIPRGLRRAPRASRSGDQRNLVVRVVKEVLQLSLGECPLRRGLLIVLDMRGGVPFEEHLSGGGYRIAVHRLDPTVVGIADIRAEHPHRVGGAQRFRSVGGACGRAGTTGVVVGGAVWCRRSQTVAPAGEPAAVLARGRSLLARLVLVGAVDAWVTPSTL